MKCFGRNTLFFNWLLVLVLVFSFGCDLKKTKIIARVGNDLITLEEFETEYLKTKTIFAAKNTTLDDKMKFLKGLTDRSIQRQSAYQQKIDQELNIKSKLEFEKKQITYLATLDENIVLKIINEDEIREFYDKSKHEIRARHILLSLPPNATAKQIDSTKTKAGEIIKEIRSGADFTQMAEKYSDDKSTLKKGGDLGFIRWGRMEDSFLNAIYSLRKFQLVTEPFRTAKGIHVVQVTDRRIFPQKPYRIARESIVKNTLLRKHYDKIMEFYNQFNKKIEKKHRVVYSDEAIDQLINKFTLKSLDSLYHRNIGKKYQDYSWIKPEIIDIKLLTYDRGSVNLIDLLKYITLEVSGNPVPLRNREDLKLVLERMIQIKLTRELGFRKNYLKKSPYKEQYDKQVEQILNSTLKNREVDLKVAITEDKMKEYYTNNQKAFIEPEKVEVQEVFIKNDKQLADEIARRAKSGESFDKLAETYNTRPVTKSKKGMLGKIKENSYGIIGETAFKMKVGEISEPLKVGANYSIIKILGREEERYRTFEEAKSTVRNKLRQELIKQKDKEWKEKMTNQIPVRVFTDKLELALNDIK